MEKREKLYEGKAKKLYATDNPDILWVEYMNQATAGNGAKKEQIEGKGRLNNRITSVIFNELSYRGIASHFVKQLSETEQLNRHLTMFPLEIIARNIAAGSFAKRYGIEEGTVLKRPVVEFCLKDDALGDPFINSDDAIALGIATADQLDIIRAKAREVNHALTAMFA
nr:phosphoribosylaminoimidazolesuccinocarboxamide synthase [Alloscardovia omnicolens]